MSDTSTVLRDMHNSSPDHCSAAAGQVYPVQVEVTGPDSKAIKSTYAAFHTFNNGQTTLSCSGLLLLSHHWQQPQQQKLTLLAPISSIYPFLQQTSRNQLAQATAASLLPGVEVSVLLPAPAGQQELPQQQQLVRLAARLASVLPLPQVHAAAHDLLMSTNSSGVGSWKLGWYLAGE